MTQLWIALQVVDKFSQNTGKQNKPKTSTIGLLFTIGGFNNKIKKKIKMFRHLFGVVIL